MLSIKELLGRDERIVDLRGAKLSIAGKVVLITGAGGSIGGRIAEIVASMSPSRLLLVERSENALFEAHRRLNAPSVVPVLHDVVDRQRTLSLVLQHQPSLIIHAAAHKHVPLTECNPSAAVENNFGGAASVIDAACAAGVKRCVLISTDKAANPVGVMGMTKRLAELYLLDKARHEQSTILCAVRFGNVLYSSGSVLETWERQIAAGQQITLTDQRMTRYFMGLGEAASLVLAASVIARPGNIFALDMGEPVSVLAMAQAVQRAAWASVGEQGMCPRIAETGLRPGERLHESLVGDGERLSPTVEPFINLVERA